MFILETFVNEGYFGENDYMQPSTVLKNEHGEIYIPKNYYEKMCVPLGEGEVFTLYYRNDDVKKVANEFFEVANTLSIFSEQFLEILKSNQEVTKVMVDNFYRQVWLYKTTLMKAYLNEEKKGFYVSDNFSLYALSVSVAGRVRKLTRGKVGKKFRNYMIIYKGNYDKKYFMIIPISYNALKYEKQVSNLGIKLYNYFLPTNTTIQKLLNIKLVIKTYMKYFIPYLMKKEIKIPQLIVSEDFAYDVLLCYSDDLQ